MNETHVEAELIAYLDNELDARARDRVEAHLAHCPVCATELVELRELQGVLGRTFSRALEPVRLPAAADRRIRTRLREQAEPRIWGGLRIGWGAWARALVALLVVAVMAGVLPILRSPVPGNLPPELLVLGQDRLAPGSRAAVRIVVRQPGTATPIAGAEVQVHLGKAPGLAQIVYRGRTDAQGTVQAAFTVPETLEGAAELVVETQTAAGSGQIVRPITITRSAKLFLSSDKTIYRSGQTLHVRALALDAVTFQPIERAEVAFEVVNAEGRSLIQKMATLSEFGVAAFDWPLAEDLPEGALTLRAVVSDTLSERRVSVGDYLPPDFRITLEPYRSFYGPGQRVTGTVEARYFFDRPVADAKVLLQGRAGSSRRLLAAEVTGRTDAEGRFDFAFNLPTNLDSTTTSGLAPFDLELTITDTVGREERLRRSLPVADQAILIQAVPESGRLKAELENTLYILTSYPDGRPVATTLTLEVGGITSTLRSDAYGLAVFRLVPSGPSVAVTIQARDSAGTMGKATLQLESEMAASGVLLRTDGAMYQVGDTLRMEALASGEIDTLYLDVVRAGQTVAALAAPVKSGWATWALDLDDSLVGTLELHAYAWLPGGERVEDTRLVVVDMPTAVVVDVKGDRPAYRPGETAHLEFQTYLAANDTVTPVEAVLGIGVVDTSAYAAEQLPPGFAHTYFLLDSELLGQSVRESNPMQTGRISGTALITVEGPEGFSYMMNSESSFAHQEHRAYLNAARDRAARATWSEIPGSRYTLEARTTTQSSNAAAKNAWSLRLGVLAVLLPLLLCAVIVRRVTTLRVLGPALRRWGAGLVGVFLAVPILNALAGWLIRWMIPLLGQWTLTGFLIPLLGVWGALVYYSWHRRDGWLQWIGTLFGAYGILACLLSMLLGQGAVLPDVLTGLVVSAFVCLVMGLGLLGAGLWAKKWHVPAGLSLALALGLILLALALPAIPGFSSGLTRMLGQPMLYAGPVGWLSGCGGGFTPTPAATEAPATMDAVTEATTEEATVEPPESESSGALPTATVLSTATPVSEEAPAAVPLEPFPLRQLFPETLYWNPEARTDVNGNLALDLPLSETLTTWRLTALASTRDGDLGAAVYDLTVSQDFFFELLLPNSLSIGEPVTGTAILYNYQSLTQTVQLELEPADWYTLQQAPQPVTLAPGDIVTVPFVLQPKQAGSVALRVTAQGDQLLDTQFWRGIIFNRP